MGDGSTERPLSEVFEMLWFDLSMKEGEIDTETGFRTVTGYMRTPEEPIPVTFVMQEEAYVSGSLRPRVRTITCEYQDVAQTVSDVSIVSSHPGQEVVAERLTNMHTVSLVLQQEAN